jgi:hypothetical protein
VSRYIAHAWDGLLFSFYNISKHKHKFVRLRLIQGIIHLAISMHAISCMGYEFTC